MILAWPLGTSRSTEVRARGGDREGREGGTGCMQVPGDVSHKNSIPGVFGGSESTEMSSR